MTALQGFDFSQMLRQAAVSKAGWLRLNRVLAWALVASPLLQWCWATPLLFGVLVDLGLVVLHGALSLVLLGRPRVPAPGIPALQWCLGILPRTAGERARFLMSGWKIMLGLVYLALPWLVNSMPSVRIHPTLSDCLIWWAVLWGLRLPFSVLGHVAGASRYALLRMRFTRDANLAADWAICVAAAVACVNLVNLFGR